MVRLFVASGLAMAALVSSTAASATDRVEAMLKPAPAQLAEGGWEAETVGVVVHSGMDELWSGTLRLGPQYGNANFSMSKNEYAKPCPGETSGKSRNSSSSTRLSVSLNRYNWQQERDKFSVNVNWSQPIPACQGSGNNSLGFNRVVEVPQGGSVTVEGIGGLKVRLTRER